MKSKTSVHSKPENCLMLTKLITY